MHKAKNPAMKEIGQKIKLYKTEGYSIHQRHQPSKIQHSMIHSFIKKALKS